ncbi:MAG: glycine--tRNA ligase subunit beta [Cyanobacteriota bacterium]
MKNYLLEIGTENLPVEFQTSAEEQLQKTVAEKLSEERLSFKEIKTYSTPRRLTLIINELADKQNDTINNLKGPPANVAFKDNQPTKAAEGFAKRCNIDINQLKIETIDNIDYVVASVEEKGKHAEEVLQNILPDLILNLKGSYFMRWENLDVRFSRPIRWLTSIMDDKCLPLQIANINASDKSIGHRFYHPDHVCINSIKEYKDKLKEAHVLVDPEERKEKIKTQVNDIARSVNGTVIENKKLLNLVNNLVEWPVAILGEFEKEYLSVPKEVITTVMSAHQKYFPVFDSNKQELLNYFICVNNRNGENTETIIKGNQRVLKARLEDGAFYYNEDRKHSLASKVEALKGVTFQKGLGNMYDKTERIKAICSEIADELNLCDAEKTKTIRAAELCKADLTTFMVREFTELEGIIGRVYALKDNEDPEVAQGVGEHYLPRSAEDNIPKSLTGKIVAMADKIDTIVSVFSIGKSPTGSADPLGVRRAALGTLLIVLKSDLKLNLSHILEKAYNSLGNIDKKEPLENVLPQVKDFITQRLRVYLNDQKYRYDAIDAVLDCKDPLKDITDTIERVQIINNLVNESEYGPFHESANRIHRILKNADIKFNVEPSLFSHISENEFNDALDKIDLDSLSHKDVVIKLKELTPIIEKFFDNVLVMDKDERIKNNRLSLVNKADLKYKTLADFSKIVY